MSDKRYKIQLGNAKAEEVSQKELDALKTTYGRSRFAAYTVTEVTSPAKPKDLEPAAPKAGRQGASATSAAE